jgi:DNA-binding XRE family transcriptional regulator
MSERHERLQKARIEANYKSKADACRRFGWNSNTYKSNENGNAPFSFEQAKSYAKAYKVRTEWLYDGTGPMHDESTDSVAIVGFVGAGSIATLFSEGQGLFDEVEAPSNATENTVGLGIRGTSLGPAFDEGIVFYDDVHSPVTEEQHGRLCVVGLLDGRVLVKILRSAGDGTYHLFSNTVEEPMLNEEVAWAARVKDVRPR